MNEHHHEGLPLSRRDLLLGGAAAGATLFFAGRNGLAQAAVSADWKWTDDRGIKIVLESQPKRVVAYNDAAAALYSFGITPAGIFGIAGLKDPNLKALPADKVSEIGIVYGEIDLEKLAAAKPDLIVSTWYPPPRDAVPFGFKDKAQLDAITAIAPVLAFNAHVIATTALRRFNRLSAALGGRPLKSPAVTQAKGRFDKQSAALKSAAGAKPGLSVLAISVFGGQAYIARPRDFADLLYFRNLGVDVVVPDTQSAFWEAVSYEQIGKYPADVIMHDARPFVTQRADLLKIPTFANLPAVKAGQLGVWDATAPFSYTHYAKNMNRLAGLIRRSSKL
ncbi:MAG: ABC transporter substrate-binding protein [Gaiellales bacterium]